MADPYSAAAMAGIQLVGGYFANQNARATASLNNRIAEMNAEFAELDAYDAEIEGYSLKARYQGVVDKTLSTQRANIAAADVDLSYGSTAEISKESRFLAEMNKMEIDKQAQEKAQGFKQQARDYRIMGSTQRAEGEARGAQAMFEGFANTAKLYAENYKEINAEVKSLSGYGS